MLMLVAGLQSTAPTSPHNMIINSYWKLFILEPFYNPMNSLNRISALTMLCYWLINWSIKLLILNNELIDLPSGNSLRRPKHQPHQERRILSATGPRICCPVAHTAFRARQLLYQLLELALDCKATDCVEKNKGGVRKRKEERMDGGSIVERMKEKMEERMDVRNSEW